MNAINKTMLVAAAIAAVFGAVEASAASFTYTDGDLLLNFRAKAGTSYGANNLTIDIGQASTYETATAVVPLTQFNTTDLNLVNNTAGDYSSFSFSALGTLFNGNKTVYSTRTRSAGSVNYNDTSLSGSTAWTSSSQAGLGATSSQIDTIAQNALTFGTALPGASAGISIADGSANGYHSYVRKSASDDTGNLNGKWKGEVETSTGTGFSTFVRADLYKNAPGVAGSYLGYFQFNADGSAFFSPQNLAAVPEPATYGIVAGLGLVALSLRNRASRKQA